MGITELVESKGYKKFMTKLYGWGASVVILGALFKIQHYPGASIMLVAGLGTEALIFFFSAFEPLHEELDWTLVYPELAGMTRIEEEIEDTHKAKPQAKKSALEKFDEMIEKAEITPELFEKLGKGLTNLNTTTEKLQDISNTTAVTNNYVANFEKASVKVNEFADVYGKSADSINKAAQQMTTNITSSFAKSNEVIQQSAVEFNKNIAQTGIEINGMVAKAGKDLANAYEKLTKNFNDENVKSTAGNKTYGEQLEVMTKNLTALNAVYELQLQGVNEHLEVSKELFKGMDDMMANLTAAIDDSKKYKTEVSKLGQNISALNTIYGNMLAAMNFKANANN